MADTMTSVHCVRQPGGKMKIFDKNMSKNLVIKDTKPYSSFKTPKTKECSEEYCHAACAQEICTDRCSPERCPGEGSAENCAVEECAKNCPKEECPPENYPEPSYAEKCPKGCPQECSTRQKPSKQLPNQRPSGKAQTSSGECSKFRESSHLLLAKTCSSEIINDSSLRRISFDEHAIKEEENEPVRPKTCPSHNLANVDQRALLDHTFRLKEWLNEKQVKAIQEKTDQEAKPVMDMTNAVLNEEETFGQDVSEFLNYQRMLNYRKKEELHKQWHRSVYQPIEKEIYREMNGPNYPELSKRKRELHKEYIEHVNRKGHVYLDTIAPEEYYPMSLHPIRPSLLVADTNRLKDPLLSQQRARSAEDRVIFRCLTGQYFTDKDLVTIKLPPLPMVSKARYGTTCNSWLEMPLGNIESPVRRASIRRMASGHNNSQFSTQDWTRKFGNKYVEMEMKLQKKRHFPMAHMESQILSKPLPETCMHHQ